MTHITDSLPASPAAAAVAPVQTFSGRLHSWLRWKVELIVTIAFTSSPFKVWWNTECRNLQHVTLMNALRKETSFLKYLTQEGGNQLDQIFFVHQPIHMIVEWNANKLHKVNKKLGEMSSNILEIQKRVVTNTFLPECSRTPLNHMLSYGISNSFQSYFGPSLTCQPKLPV